MDWVKDALGYLIVFGIWVIALRIFLKGNQDAGTAKEKGDVDSVEKHTIRTTVSLIIVIVLPFVAYFVFDLE